MRRSVRSGWTPGSSSGHSPPSWEGWGPHESDTGAAVLELAGRYVSPNVGTAGPERLGRERTRLRDEVRLVHAATPRPRPRHRHRTPPRPLPAHDEGEGDLRRRPRAGDGRRLPD